MKKNKFFLIATLLSLSVNVHAYIADRCDWSDCEAMANGTNEGGLSTFLIMIIIGGIIYLVSK